MGTYWVDKSIGTSGGDGSAELPWDTLASANAGRTFVAGDIINCINGTDAGGGVSRSGVVWTGNLTGVTIQTVPGLTGYEERKSTLMEVGDIVNVAGDVYEYPAGAGLNIRGVSWDYGNNTTATGSRYGFLVAVASAVLVNSAGKYYYDSVTGLITFNVGGDATARPVEFAIRTADNVAVVQFNQMTDCVVSGLTISYGLMNNGEGQYGNGLSATTCVRTLWIGNKLYDCGNHSTLMSGGNLVDNRISGNTYHGCADSGIMHVFFAATTSTGSNEAADNVMYLHGYLNLNGSAQRDTMNGISGFYSHVGGGGTVIDNLTYRRNTVTFLFGLLGNPFTAGNATAPSDPENFTTYSIKFIDCVMRGGCQGGMISGNVAFVNCDFDWSTTNATAGGYAMLMNTNAEYWGFFGSIITCNGVYGIFNIRNSAHVYAIACTIINRDLTNTYAQPLWQADGTQTVVQRDCLLGYQRTGGNGRTLGGVTMTCSNNAYYNFSDTTGDSTPTVISTNPFTAIATSGALTAAARIIKHAGTNPAGGLRGVNHRRYNKNYGAYQYPPSERGQRNRAGTGPLSRRLGRPLP